MSSSAPSARNTVSGSGLSRVDGIWFPASECAVPHGPCQWFVAPRPCRRVARELEKGLHYRDFFPTMTTANSSLIKYQRERVEKPNFPGRGFVSA